MKYFDFDYGLPSVVFFLVILFYFFVFYQFVQSFVSKLLVCITHRARVRL